jgi:hypothetical protein
VIVGGAVAGAGCAWLILALARRFHELNLERAAYLGLLLAAYAIFVLRWSREHAWKWLVLAFMAVGLLAIALVVPGGATALFPHAALFLGLVWLGSGLGTLYSYVRHTQPPAPEAP